MKQPSHWWVRAARYIEGFWLPGRPQSLARVLSAPTILTGCYVAIKHPDQWQTATGLVTAGTALYATRTIGTNGSTRPFWSRLPQQAVVDRAEKVVQAMTERVTAAPSQPVVVPVVVPKAPQ